MKNLLWFALGLAGGFVAAHYVNKDPRGHEVLAEVDARISQFTDRIADAYREQEARIAGIVEDAVDAASATVETVTDAVADATGDAAEAAKDATKKLTD
ncbi:ATPase [Microbacterium schleiferi]|uniref:ATPase n=1 Tax=Microbacterium schleiferi TaxID=69362 RepID=UPI001E6497F0|nr:ATPase [Microbacterium schleiferi]